MGNPTFIIQENGNIKTIDISALSKPSIERERWFQANLRTIPSKNQSKTLRDHHIFWTSGALESITANLQTKTISIKFLKSREIKTVKLSTLPADLKTIGLLSDTAKEETLFKIISITQNFLSSNTYENISLTLIKEKIRHIELQIKLLKKFQEDTCRGTFSDFKHHVKNLKKIDRQLKELTDQIHDLEKANYNEKSLSEMKETRCFLESILEKNKFKEKIIQLDRSQNLPEEIEILTTTLQHLQQFVKEHEIPMTKPPVDMKAKAQQILTEIAHPFSMKKSLKQDLYEKLFDFLKNPERYPKEGLSVEQRRLLADTGNDLLEIGDMLVDLNRLPQPTTEHEIFEREEECNDLRKKQADLEKTIFDLLIKLPLLTP